MGLSFDIYFTIKIDWGGGGIAYSKLIFVLSLSFPFAPRISGDSKVMTSQLVQRVWPLTARICAHGSKNLIHIHEYFDNLFTSAYIWDFSLDMKKEAGVGCIIKNKSNQSKQSNSTLQISIFRQKQKILLFSLWAYMLIFKVKFARHLTQIWSYPWNIYKRS